MRRATTCAVLLAPSHPEPSKKGLTNMPTFRRIIFASTLALACRGEFAELLPSLGKDRPPHGSEPGRPPRGLDPECAETFEARATVVRETFAACDTDADCTLVEGPGCLSAFLCTNAVARGSEQEYSSAAQLEVDEYIEECGNFCSVADCVSASDLRAVCDSSTRTCVPVSVL
jgi:hypothetical protein